MIKVLVNDDSDIHYAWLPFLPVLSPLDAFQSVTFADWQTLFQPELDTSKIKMEPVLDLPLSLHSAGRLIWEEKKRKS